MTRALLLRHAESIWNATGRWQGWADPPLSDAGRQAALDAAARLAAYQPQAVASSDLERARRTAALLAGALLAGGPEPVTDADLREYDAGDWTGLTRTEIAARWPGWLEAWDAGRIDHTSGGEDLDAFAARVQRGVRRAAAGPGTALIVTHSGVIRRLVRDLGGRLDSVGHLGGALLEVPAAGRLELLGSVSLLGPSEAPPPPLRSTS